MANTARQVKRRISTARNISKITKAMEMVAASKMRRAQDQAVAAKPFALHLFNSLNAITRKVDPTLHPLLSQHSAGIHVALVIATDKGLCGSLNTHLVKKLNELRRHHGDQDFGVVAVGKKAVLFCRAFGYKVVAQFTELPEKIAAGDIVPISRLLIEKFLAQEFQSVTLVYMDFVNTLKQVPKSEQLLPISKDAVSIPSTRTWSLDNSTPDVENAPMPAEYSFEPGAKQILNDLLPFYIEVVMYHAFLEARASEHSARMVAMKNASQNASELVQELLLIFNKSRQQSITNELLDITTASLTLT